MPRARQYRQLNKTGLFADLHLHEDILRGESFEIRPQRLLFAEPSLFPGGEEGQILQLDAADSEGVLVELGVLDALPISKSSAELGMDW